MRKKPATVCSKAISGDFWENRATPVPGMYY